VSLYFESIMESDYVYDSASLAQIFDRRDEHARYSNLIELFYKDLKASLVDIRSYIKQLFEPKPVRVVLESPPKVEIVFVDGRNNPDIVNQSVMKESYHYELGKLATKRNRMDFQFFSGLLRSRCEGNEPVLAELDHMERFLGNDIEYHCALRLIEKHLGEA